MSVLFRVRYVGSEGAGVAAISIGSGKIIGFDGAEGLYQGKYIEENGRVRGSASYTLPPQWPLVTGGTSDEGGPFELTFDWPASCISDGEPHQLFINGQPLKATLTRIGEID